MFPEGCLIKVVVLVLILIKANFSALKLRIVQIICSSGSYFYTRSTVFESKGLRTYAQTQRLWGPLSRGSIMHIWKILFFVDFVCRLNKANSSLSKIFNLFFYVSKRKFKTFWDLKNTEAVMYQKKLDYIHENNFEKLEI